MLARTETDSLALDTRFRVQALADAHVALRLLNLFAQRDLVVDEARLERHGDMLSVELRLARLPVEIAAVIAEKMRALVQVVSVEWDARAP